MALLLGLLHAMWKVMINEIKAVSNDRVTGYELAHISLKTGGVNSSCLQACANGPGQMINAYSYCIKSCSITLGFLNLFDVVLFVLSCCLNLDSACLIFYLFLSLCF